MVSSTVPFDQRDGFLWLDGKFVEWKQAKTHILNHGLNYGSSIFEGERVYNGKIFKPAEHTTRFFNSARLMDFDLPFSFDEIEKAKKEAVAKNNISYGYMKVVAWRGTEQMTVSGDQCRIHLLIAVWDVGKEFNKNAQKNGIKVCLSKWKRPSADSFPHEAKIGGGYVVNTLSKHDAHKRDYNDALLLDYRGYIAEGASANFFAVKNGELYTPIADCFLNGITRQTIIEIAKEHNIPVNEVRMKLEDLKDYAEVFFTGSAAGVSPINQIEDLVFKVGPVTNMLVKLYLEQVNK